MPRPFELPEAARLSEQTGEHFSVLVRLMQRLLAPDGCPWDREQSPESLKRYVLEEACELIDAIDGGDPGLVKEELGDLALQIAFLGEIFRTRGEFGPDEVMLEICTKLVRRHPHVFADVDAATADDVLVNWDRIKNEEKRQRPLLDSIPKSLPVRPSLLKIVAIKGHIS
jgi:tetrapyrrole methylase family protein/MazG family protein/ATP diphosphatase